MKIKNFAGTNLTLPQLGNASCMLVEEKGVKCLVTAWTPSKEDLKELNAGKPLFVQVYKEQPVMMLYTVDKNGLPCKS